MAKKSVEKPKNLHVVPVPKGGWAIKDAGSPKPIKTFATKAEATAYAKEIAGPSKSSGQYTAKTGMIKKPVGKKVAVKTTVVTHEMWILASKPAKQGKVSQVAPGQTKKGSPKFGSAQGKFVIAADFEKTPEDFHEYVE